LLLLVPAPRGPKLSGSVVCLPKKMKARPLV
jgi:hypothetical protein